MTAADWHDHSVAFLMGKAVEAASAFTDEEEESESDAESEPCGPRAPGDDGGTDSRAGKGGSRGSPEAAGGGAATPGSRGGGGHGRAPRTSAAASSARRRRRRRLLPPPPSDPIPPVHPRTARPHRPTRTEVYYFYQAEDGQPVVLHGACVRVLLAHHGSYEPLPLTLEAPVVELERHTQDEDTRRRAAHLRHLPLTTQYAIAELDMTNLVPAETLREHGEELRRREACRRKRADGERKAEAAAVAAEARERRNARVFSADKRGAMPDVRGLAAGAGGAGATTTPTKTRRIHPVSPGRARSHPRRGARPREDVRGGGGCGFRRGDGGGEGGGSRGGWSAGTSFSRVARWGFASGLDAPTLTPDLDLTATRSARLCRRRGVRRGGDGAGVAAGGDGGASSGAWGASARFADAAADAEPVAAAEEGRRRKGRKGTVLFEMGGARRY